MNNFPDKQPQSEILIYQTDGGHTRIQVRLENETVWLTQADMAQLFLTTPQNITLHLKSIFNEGELSEGATCKDFLQVQIEGGHNIQRIYINDPSPVEQHFLKVVNDVKMLDKEQNEKKKTIRSRMTQSKKTTMKMFIGKWAIVEMESWDQDYVNMELEGHFTFNKKGNRYE
jgi:hypothetical protein